MNTSARLLAVIVGVGIGALATGSFTPAPAIAQTTSVALTRSLEAHMDRPLTPPEAWAVTAAAKSHTMDVRRIRERFAMRLAEATGLALDTVAPLIPPLGRGTQSAMPPDIAGSLADLLGRPLTPRESASVAAAEAERQSALTSYRATLVETLHTLTELPRERIASILPKLGL